MGLSFAELGSPLNMHLTVRVFDVTGVWPPVEVELCCCVQGGKSSVSDIFLSKFLSIIALAGVSVDENCRKSQRTFVHTCCRGHPPSSTAAGMLLAHGTQVPASERTWAVDRVDREIPAAGTHPEKVLTSHCSRSLLQLGMRAGWC